MFDDVLDDDLYWEDLDAYLEEEGEWTDSRGGRHTFGAAAFEKVQVDYDGV